MGLLKMWDETRRSSRHEWGSQVAIVFKAVAQTRYLDAKSRACSDAGMGVLFGASSAAV